MLTAKALQLVRLHVERTDEEEAKDQQQSSGLLKSIDAMLPPQASYLKAAIKIVDRLPEPMQVVLALSAEVVLLGVTYSLYRTIRTLTDWFGAKIPEYADLPVVGTVADLFGKPVPFQPPADDLASLLSSELTNVQDTTGTTAFRLRTPSSVAYNDVAPSGSIPLASLQVVGGLPKASPAVAQALEFASRTFGIPLDETYATALQESGLGTNMAAPTSSARGLFQFIASTWNELRRRYPAYVKAYNIGAANGKSLSDDRMDLIKSAVMYGLFRNENTEYLKGLSSGNQTVDSYLAHFLGAGGARRLLTALRATPDAPVTSAVEPTQYAANKSFMQVSKSDARVLSVKDFVQRVYNKIGLVAARYAQSFQRSDTAGLRVSGLTQNEPTFSSVIQSSDVSQPNKVKAPETSSESFSRKTTRRHGALETSYDYGQTPNTQVASIGPVSVLPPKSYAAVRLDSGYTVLTPL